MGQRKYNLRSNLPLVVDFLGNVGYIGNNQNNTNQSNPSMVAPTNNITRVAQKQMDGENSPPVERHKATSIGQHLATNFSAHVGCLYTKLSREKNS